MKRYRTDTQLQRQVRFANSAVLDRGHVIHLARCAVCGARLTAESVGEMNELRRNHREKHRWTEE